MVTSSWPRAIAWTSRPAPTTRPRWVATACRASRRFADDVGGVPRRPALLPGARRHRHVRPEPCPGDVGSGPRAPAHAVPRAVPRDDARAVDAAVLGRGAA